MGLFKRKVELPYQNPSLEACKRELSQIIRKKQELERRLEILTKARPTKTVILTDDSSYAQTNVIESEIQIIMIQLRNKDANEELVRHEIERKEVDKRKSERREALERLIEVKPIDRGKDLTGEVTISETEASKGKEKVIEYLKDGKKAKIVFKIPPGVKQRTKIRLKGLGLKGRPPGDLYITIKAVKK